MNPRRLLLPVAERGVLRRRATESFPEECCGILVGRFRGENETLVSQLVPVANVSADRDQRYAIDPLDVLSVHRWARRTGETIVGFYHSHPVGRCRPSRRDRRSAWPNASYLIVTPEGGLASWRCAAGGSFESEAVVDIGHDGRAM
jgi:proteasome lid subunit RPN8/RPN11